VKSSPEYAKRVYIIGAGMSREVGAPGIDDFLEELLRRVPKSRTQRLREFRARYGRKRNIEKMLSEIDKHIIEGKNLDGYDVPSLRKIRAEIVNGISDTLASIQYHFLSAHYDYKRYEDPYYYWSRDFKAVERIKAKYPEESDDWELEVARQRAKLREGRSLGEVGDLHCSEIRHLFARPGADPHVVYLLSAALAAGQDRFREWLCTVWPLYLCLGDEELKISPRAWNEDIKNECIDRFLAVLNDPAAKDVESVGGWLKEELIELLGEWKGKRGIGQEYIWECAWHLREDVYPIIVRNAEWIRRQAAYLLQGLQDRINPYALLAGLLTRADTVITLNYDLFTEIAIKTLYSDSSIDYRIPDLVGVTPWDLCAGPFLNYVTEPRFTVLKLHGSINWIRCPFCSGMYYTFETPANTSAIRYILRDLARFMSDAYRDYPCCYLFEPSEVEIPIIPPTLKKSMRVGALAKIWGKAREEIVLADELIFIGYALSPSDSDIRELLRNAVDSRYSGKLDEYAKQIMLKDMGVVSSASYWSREDLVNAVKYLESRQYVPLSRRVLIVKVVNSSPQDQARYRDFFSGIANIQLDEPIECTASEYLRKEFLNTLPDYLFRKTSLEKAGSASTG